MLREAERAVDHQVRVMEEQDDKTERVRTLSVAALGGALALATFVRQFAPLDGPFLVVFGAGALANLLALLRFLRAYVALPKARATGPDPRWIAEKANESTWSRERHLIALLQNYPAYFDHNAAVLARVVAERLAGLLLLTGSLGAYAAGAIYILGKGVI